MVTGMTTFSPTLYVYGYEIDPVNAVKYLVEKDSYWAKNYNMFINHPKAMDVIAEELSKNCDLPLHALQLWVGSHYTGYGIVFFDDSMVPRKRTPEDTEKLHKLERLLESMAILKTEKAKFDVLCSAACLAHPVEPALVAKRPPPPDWERNKGQELMCLMDELMEKYPRRRQRKSGEEKDSGDKTVGSKKRQNQPRSEGHHGQAVHKSSTAPRRNPPRRVRGVDENHGEGSKVGQGGMQETS